MEKRKRGAKTIRLLDYSPIETFDGDAVIDDAISSSSSSWSTSILDGATNVLLATR